MSSGIAEKGQIGTVFTDDIPTPAKGNVHYVNRNGDDTPKSFEEELIPGYDATLMGARATLRAAEEKKLLRRIGWRLILLLALRSNIDGGIRLSRRTVRLPDTGGVYAATIVAGGFSTACSVSTWSLGILPF
ncbi:unnamed protein product [Penicillium viridicatum]